MKVIHRPDARIIAGHAAEAFEAVARVNHYMVQVVLGDMTDADLAAAEQLLITKQNAGPQEGEQFVVLELALDLIDAARLKLAIARRQT